MLPTGSAATPAVAAPAGDAASRHIQRIQSELEELRAVKARRDAQFDQLASVVEQRTDQFKRLIAERQTEIEALRAQLRQASAKVRVLKS